MQTTETPEEKAKRDLAFETANAKAVDSSGLTPDQRALRDIRLPVCQSCSRRHALYPVDKEEKVAVSCGPDRKCCGGYSLISGPKCRFWKK